MTTAAFLPFVLVVTFHQVDDRTNYFYRRVDSNKLVNLGITKAERENEPVPHFKLGILDDSWVPELHWAPSDQKYIQWIKKDHSWASRVFKHHAHAPEKQGSGLAEKNAEGIEHRKRHRPGR